MKILMRSKVSVEREAWLAESLPTEKFCSSRVYE